MSATPYRLAFCPRRHLIFAQGTERQVSALLTAPGSNRVAAEAATVSLPAERENFLAVEAIAAPVSVSADYQRGRKEAMRPPRGAFHTSWQRPLLPHQKDFLQHGVTRRGMMNASEQGLGKTTMAWTLAANWARGGCRALIVCPKSLAYGWCDEFRLLWGEVKPFVPMLLDEGPLAGRAAALRGATRGATQFPIAAIVNYEALHGLRAALLAFGPQIVIFDESWRIKNPRAQVTKAALALADQAEHVLCLTGTPIGNGVEDLWSQLRVLGEDVMPFDYPTFLRRYAQMALLDLGGRQVWKPVGISDAPGLMRQLAPAWFRATKATCLALPPKVHERVLLRLPERSRRRYEVVEKDGEVALGASLSLNGDRVTCLRLQQLTAGLIPVPRDAHGSDWMVLPDPDCPKRAWIKQFAAESLSGNPSMRAIIWCRFTVELQAITEMLQAVLGESKVAAVWGETTNEALAAITESFNSRDVEGAQVIVAQIKKLAYGANLQACDVNIRASHSWSYVETIQAEDRSHRMGRAEAVRYVDLVIENSVDEDILKTLERKEDFALRLAPDTTTSLAP